MGEANRNQFCQKNILHLQGKSLAKGQIKSEWIYEIINFPNNDPKYLKDFCPMYYKNSQG